MIDGMERSAIFPERVTKAMPAETMPSSAMAFRILIRLPVVKNSSETSEPAMSSSTHGRKIPIWS